MYEPHNVFVVMLVPPDNDDETVSPSHAELHDMACQL